MVDSALPSFKKILVANRGEIAVRAFRAAYETGAKTVAIYPREDRNSFHRAFADEAVRVGQIKREASSSSLLMKLATQYKRS